MKAALFSSILIMSMSCSGPNPGLFGPAAPHDEYRQKLNRAGLDETALGSRWLAAARQSLQAPLTITLPYAEKGFFAAEDPAAAGWSFTALRGEIVNASVIANPADSFLLFLELWQIAQDGKDPKRLATADTTSSLSFEIRESGTFILRLQPELLRSGSYEIEITTAPSLAFPVGPEAKPRIGSYWGAQRDGGARSHEGIDIFAAKRTPLLAAADGTVSAVRNNNLGGKRFSFVYAEKTTHCITPISTNNS